MANHEHDFITKILPLREAYQIEEINKLFLEKLELKEYDFVNDLINDLSFYIKVFKIPVSITILSISAKNKKNLPQREKFYNKLKKHLTDICKYDKEVTYFLSDLE